MKLFIGALFFLASTAMAVSNKMLCEGHEPDGNQTFWYDIHFFGEEVESRLSHSSAQTGLVIELPVRSKLVDGKFEVQSPYIEFKARIAKENEYWILDLMKMNGNFVIPTYDYFACVSQ